MFRYLVLGLLRDGEFRHGYALMKEYRERSGLQLSTGSFYRELQRLVGEGLVRTARNPTDADPRRAPYEITESGAAAFDRWLTGPAGTGIGRYDDELSARAFFVAKAELGTARKLFDSWRDELWVRGKMHERARDAALSESPEEFAALPFLLGRNLKHIAADLEFLDELRTAYEASAANPGPKRKDTSPIAKRARIAKTSK